MGLEITEITEPETRISVKFRDEDGFSDSIVLCGEELTAFSTGDRKHFLDHIESLKQSHAENFHEMSKYLAALSEPGSYSKYDTDKIMEAVNEMKNITGTIKHNQVALAAMDGKFSA